MPLSQANRVSPPPPGPVIRTTTAVRRRAAAPSSHVRAAASGRHVHLAHAQVGRKEGGEQADRRRHVVQRLEVRPRKIGEFRIGYQLDGPRAPRSGQTAWLPAPSTAARPPGSAPPRHAAQLDPRRRDERLSAGIARVQERIPQVVAPFIPAGPPPRLPRLRGERHRPSPGSGVFVLNRPTAAPAAVGRGLASGSASPSLSRLRSPSQSRLRSRSPLGSRFRRRADACRSRSPCWSQSASGQPSPARRSRVRPIHHRRRPGSPPPEAPTLPPAPTVSIPRRQHPERNDRRERSRRQHPERNDRRERSRRQHPERNDRRERVRRQHPERNDRRERVRRQHPERNDRRERAQGSTLSGAPEARSRRALWLSRSFRAGSPRCILRRRIQRAACVVRPTGKIAPGVQIRRIRRLHRKRRLPPFGAPCTMLRSSARTRCGQ